jgi:branched-chain amino acid transport system permease protein
VKARSVVLLGLCVAAFLSLPAFLREYSLHVLIVGLYYVAMAASWNLLSGYGGQMSFAHVSFATFGAYASTILATRYHLPIPLTMLAGALGASVVGWLLGVICLRMRGIYHSLTTIAFAEIFRSACNLEYEITHGAIGMSSPPLFGDSVSKVPYFYAAFLLAALTLAIIYLITRSPVGLTLRAMRNDQTACAAVGVDLNGHKLFTFVVVSFLAGLSGAFLAHYTLLASPETATISQMGIIIAMAVIGGLGTFWGPVVGAMGVEVVSEYVRNFGEYHLLLFGLVLVVVLRFAPGGIVPWVGTIRARLAPVGKPMGKEA